jgi:hypothetical protein
MRYVLIFTLAVFFAGSAFGQKEFTLTGTMLHTDLEGGCWYLETKRGQKYELVGNEEDLRKVRVEGRLVTLTVRQKKMAASICMMGTIVEILEVLDTNRYPKDPAWELKRIRGVVSRTDDGFWYIRGYDGKNYEMAKYIVPPYYKPGLRFNRQTKIITGSEGALDMHMVIVEVIRPEEKIKAKYNDPR